MPKVIIDPIKGLYEVPGEGVEIAKGVKFSSPPMLNVDAKTSNSVITEAGIYTISGGGALTMTMPLASSVAGGTFVFRNASAHAHVLTGSQELNGTKVFAGQVGATPDTSGSSLTLPAVNGCSVALISDGLSYLVMAASGSIVISGT